MAVGCIARGGARSGRSTTRDAATHGHPVIRIGGRPPLPKEVSHPSRSQNSALSSPAGLGRWPDRRVARPAPAGPVLAGTARRLRWTHSGCKRCVAKGCLGFRIIIRRRSNPYGDSFRGIRCLRSRRRGPAESRRTGCRTESPVRRVHAGKPGSTWQSSLIGWRICDGRRRNAEPQLGDGADEEKRIRTKNERQAHCSLFVPFNAPWLDGASEAGIKYGCDGSHRLARCGWHPRSTGTIWSCGERLM
ncbi:hypothetical protein [Azospirillum argentinense]